MIEVQIKFQGQVIREINLGNYSVSTFNSEFA